MSERRYQGKAVLITGAAGGFGRAAALRFAHEGADLSLSDVDEAGLEETVALIHERSGHVEASFCDVSDEQSVETMVARSVSALGPLDVAINNAGVAHPFTRLADTDLATFERMVSVNLTGVFLCMREEIRVMKKAGGGVILNVASVAGLVGAPKLGAYAASKHGVIGLTKTAAAEVAGDNIRVNALCPSYADTAMVSGITEDMEGTAQEAAQRIVRGIPMQRLATSEEVVNAMAWLCSDENSFMTGHTVTLDGGGTAV